jgi:hypothetical protein
VGSIPTFGIKGKRPPAHESANCVPFADLTLDDDRHVAVIEVHSVAVRRA